MSLSLTEALARRAPFPDAAPIIGIPACAEFRLMGELRAPVTFLRVLRQHGVSLALASQILDALAAQGAATATLPTVDHPAQLEADCSDLGVVAIVRTRISA